MTVVNALQIVRWAAWAPGLDAAADWAEWLATPTPLRGDEVAAPPLAEVPAMVRRRIDPLGRMALQVAYRAQDDLTPEAVQAMPLVFASRWGELDRSVALLQDLARQQPLSPTAFSHSVHNAIGALYSIQRGVRANLSAVAAGAYSLEAGWIEVLGLLREGASEVLLVAFDAPLPAAYAASGLDAARMRPHALALRLRLGGSLQLQAEPKTTEPDDGLPPALRALRFFTGGEAELRQGPWRWSRAC
ncbi:MAG: beta-ketoacyl synthase chain length factor [Inhella sp.]